MKSGRQAPTIKDAEKIARLLVETFPSIDGVLLYRSLAAHCKMRRTFNRRRRISRNDLADLRKKPDPSKRERWRSSTWTGVQAMRVTFEPGWRWSECVKPVAGTDSCRVSHLFNVLSGRLVVRMDDGSEAEFGPGDMGLIPPGHDAWTVGDEPFVCIDYQGGAVYAKQKSSLSGAVLSAPKIP